MSTSYANARARFEATGHKTGVPKSPACASPYSRSSSFRLGKAVASHKKDDMDMSTGTVSTVCMDESYSSIGWNSMPSISYCHGEEHDFHEKDSNPEFHEEDLFVNAPSPKKTLKKAYSGRTLLLPLEEKMRAIAMSRKNTRPLVSSMPSLADSVKEAKEEEQKKDSSKESVENDIFIRNSDEQPSTPQSKRDALKKVYSGRTLLLPIEEKMRAVAIARRGGQFEPQFESSCSVRDRLKAFQQN